jgi:hypothetical protein
MSIVYNWQVSQLNCLPSVEGKQDYVVTVHYNCSGADGDYSGNVYSTCSLPVVEGASFVPYADLTLDTVLGWIWANGVDKDATEAAVAQQIENAKNPPIVSPQLPWVAA